MEGHAVSGTCIQETHCAPLTVHLCMHTYPVVFLEPLSVAGTAFAPPLCSVLRIKVKESLSKGKLGKKNKKRERGEERRGKWIRNRSRDEDGGSTVAAIRKSANAKRKIQ